jgi:nitrite reductase/ring-hydroxylating ferredoxin subunit
VFVIDNVCSHNRSPLAGGSVSGTVVTCRTHRARFSLETGQAVRGPARRPIRTYPVTVSEERVAITVG